MKVLRFTFLIVILDQVTKLIVKGFSLPFMNFSFEGMNYGESIPVIGKFFMITFVENPGMAFGIDLGASSKLFLSLFSLVASIGIVVYLYSVRDQKLVIRLALALILAGAIGNLIDRTFYGVLYGYAPLFYGKVVDFFNVDFIDFSLFGHTYDRWPIFNIADASVTIGVFLLLFFYRTEEENEAEPELVESEGGYGINPETRPETGRTLNADAEDKKSGDGKTYQREGIDFSGS